MLQSREMRCVRSAGVGAAEPTPDFHRDAMFGFGPWEYPMSCEQIEAQLQDIAGLSESFHAQYQHNNLDVVDAVDAAPVRKFSWEICSIGRCTRDFSNEGLETFESIRKLMTS